MTIRSKTGLLLLMACCISLKLQAQKQRYQAELGPVHETAFYEIAITPELLSALAEPRSIERSSGEMPR